MTQELDKVKHDLVIAAHRAYYRGIQSGNGGNLSARVPGKDEMIIKPSGVSFIDCDENSWIVTDFYGNKISGDGKPSSEAPLHGAIYRLCPWAGGIVHGHAVYSNILALQEDVIPVYLFHGLTKLDDFVQVLDVKNDGVMPEDMPLVEQFFREHPKAGAFILRRHGVVAYGKDALRAEHNAELVEEMSEVAWGSRVYQAAVGKTVEPLDQKWFDDFNAKQ
jgi:L-ribulose-5-phosphate 4-epimerase